MLLRAGADKVAVNTSAVSDPALVEQIARRFGSQAVVLAIDARAGGAGFEVFVHGGRTATGKDAVAWAREGSERGASWVRARVAPITVKRLVLSQPAMPFFVETKLSLFTGTTNFRLAGLIWSTTEALGLGVSFYAYYLAYYKNEGRLIVDYQYPTGAARLFNSGAIVDPASAPHWYRIYWNPYNRPLWIQELSLLLGTDQLCFAYSTDGTTWTSLGTRAKDFEPVMAGIHCRKWETSAVSAEADFDYFSVQQYNEADLVSRPQIGRGNQDTVGFEDQGVLITESGPPRFDLSAIGSGVVLTPPTPISFEDQGGLLTQSGLPSFDIPEFADAPVVPVDGIAFEEGLFVQLDNTDYIKGKLDGDGKELLGGVACQAHPLLRCDA